MTELQLEAPGSGSSRSARRSRSAFAGILTMPRGDSVFSIPRRRRGFTLIELLVAMGLIVFIVSISVPVLAPFFSRRALDGAVDQVKGALDVARISAIRKHRVMYFACQLVDKQKGVYRVTGDYGAQVKEWVRLPEFVDVGILTDRNAGANTYDYESTFELYAGMSDPQPITALVAFRPDGSCYLMRRVLGTAVTTEPEIAIIVRDRTAEELLDTTLLASSLSILCTNPATVQRAKTIILNRNTGRARLQ